MDCGGPCGYISSPGYPAPLTALRATNCRWWIRASQNQVVEIDFLDFDVKYHAEDDSRRAADPRCLQAYVSLFTVADENELFFTRNPIGRFCNDNKPPDDGIVSTSSVLELQYSSKETSGGNPTRGFLARYRLQDLNLVVVDAGNITQGNFLPKKTRFTE